LRREVHHDPFGIVVFIPIGTGRLAQAELAHFLTPVLADEVGGDPV